MALTVGSVAALAKVSVRTLHHYDELGLLKPSARSESGYRLYTDGDLERLQQVLFYRELGFSLDDIGQLMSDPDYDAALALADQRELLEHQLKRTQAMIALIDTTMMSMEGVIQMTKEEMFDVFGDFDPAQYEAEVQQRWGDSDAYKESTRRAKRYTKADWERFKAEQDDAMATMLELFDAGVAPTDSRAMDVAESARLQIDQWFYPCSKQFHVNLGEMYVSDPRFTAYYDKHREGLAVWFRDAIRANAERE
jgi:MerR family transcriptional regulator, thiopeptide resistance regulator